MTTTGCLLVHQILGSPPYYMQTHSLIPLGNNGKFLSSYYVPDQIPGTLSDIQFFFFFNHAQMWLLWCTDLHIRKTNFLRTQVNNMQWKNRYRAHNRLLDLERIPGTQMSLICSNSVLSHAPMARVLTLEVANAPRLGLNSSP